MLWQCRHCRCQCQSNALKTWLLNKNIEIVLEDVLVSLFVENQFGVLGGFPLHLEGLVDERCSATNMKLMRLW